MRLTSTFLDTSYYECNTKTNKTKGSTSDCNDTSYTKGIGCSLILLVTRSSLNITICERKAALNWGYIQGRCVSSWYVGSWCVGSWYVGSWCVFS